MEKCSTPHSSGSALNGNLFLHIMYAKSQSIRLFGDVPKCLVRSSLTCVFIICLDLSDKYGTVSPLYTDTRYNDKIRYNDNLDNLTGKKPSHKR